MKNYKYFDLVMAAFVVVLLISDVASNKIVQLTKLSFANQTFSLVFDGGTILFPLSYIFGDVLTEVYGYKRSRRVIWTGLGASVLLALILWMVTSLPIPTDAGPQPQSEAFNVALASTPYIVLGSLVAFWAGEFSNSFVLAKMKIFTRGRWLWTRTIGSTLVGEGIDTLLFTTIAFALGGALLGSPMEGGLFTSLVLSNYIFKVGVEVLFTPVTYTVVSFLKRSEHEDYYDRNTNFNPFAVQDSHPEREIAA